MNEVQVKKVSPDRVIIQVLNVEFVFTRSKNGSDRKLIISKRKPDAQIHDPDACRVPANLFNQACRQAAAILLSPKQPPKRQRRQTLLFDEVPP